MSHLGNSETTQSYKIPSIGSHQCCQGKRGVRDTERKRAKINFSLGSGWVTTPFSTSVLELCELRSQDFSLLLFFEGFCFLSKKTFYYHNGLRNWTRFCCWLYVLHLKPVYTGQSHRVTRARSPNTHHYYNYWCPDLCRICIITVTPLIKWYKIPVSLIFSVFCRLLLQRRVLPEVRLVITHLSASAPFVNG